MRRLHDRRGPPLLARSERERGYETNDNSRNLWWVGLLAYGEGWHNNHHAFQRSARHGHRWWELDLTYVAIRVMESIGLAWDVVRVSPA